MDVLRTLEILSILNFRRFYVLCLTYWYIKLSYTLYTIQTTEGLKILKYFLNDFTIVQKKYVKTDFFIIFLAENRTTKNYKQSRIFIL